MARRPIESAQVEEAAPAASDPAVIARVEKLRGWGERQRAIDLAMEHKLKPEDVPFLDGYTAE